MPSDLTLTVRVRFRRGWLRPLVIPIGQFLVFWFVVNPETYADFAMRLLGAEWNVEPSKRWEALRP